MSPFRRRATIAAGLIAILVGVSAASAQRFGGFGSFREGTFPTLWAPPEMPDGSFIFCRLAYRSVRFEQSGIGWQTDYPYAEINLMTRLSELTRAHISRDENMSPRHYVVRLTDDTLFNCPFLMASDPGTAGFSDVEADRLRTYLLKGGFLWVDDYWGNAAWNQFATQIGKALPPADFPIEDVQPDDPMMHAVFSMMRVPQVSNFQFWRRSGGRTSERGPETEEVHFRVIRDPKHRVVVVMTHNTDIGDSWEREGEDPEYFRLMSPPGYALGVNVLVHAMTH